MKKVIGTLMAVVVASSMSTSASVIAGLDTWDDAIAPTVPVLAPDVTASLVTTTEDQAWNTGDSRGASSDGTWGTFAGPPSADTTVATGQNLELPNATTGGTITLSITNGSLTAIELGAFHFDALAFRPKAARTYVLSVVSGGGITDGVVYTSGAQEITSQGGTPPDNDQGDDIDHSLTGLADHTLEAGETAQFLLTFSGGLGDASGGHDLWIDNLAVSAVPEPGTLGLIAAFGGGVLFIRRRFMM